MPRMPTATASRACRFYVREESIVERSGHVEPSSTSAPVRGCCALITCLVPATPRFRGASWLASWSGHRALFGAKRSDHEMCCYLSALGETHQILGFVSFAAETKIENFFRPKSAVVGQPAVGSFSVPSDGGAALEDDTDAALSLAKRQSAPRRSPADVR
jgi:hypothetical protein